MTSLQVSAGPADNDEMRAAFVETAGRLAARDVASRVTLLDTHPCDIRAARVLCGTLRDAGMLDMAMPESAGGLGLGRQTIGEILARLAETCAGVALLVWANESAGLAMAAKGGATGGDTGGRFVANGLVTGSPLRATRRTGGDWRMDGSLPFAWGAGCADEVLLAAKTERGGIFARVPLDAAGLVVGDPDDRIGLRACPSATLTLDGVAVVPFAVHADAAEFEGAVADARADAFVLAGAIACGNARGALRRAMQYARERYQGGSIIIEHTLVQGLLGKQLADLRAAEALVATALARGGDDRLLARVVATRHGESVCLDAMQVFGGYGYMRDYGVEKHLRDAKMLCLVGGGNERVLQSVVAAHRMREDWP